MSIQTPHVRPPTPVPPDLVLSAEAPIPDAARPRRSRMRWPDVILGLMACGAVLLWLESVIGVYMPDDAYITYRYAENLAAGQGLVFNAAAPPVEGYSNLSWIVLLAGLTVLHLDLPTWAANLGRALSLLNLGLVYALSYSILHRKGWALVAPALLALTAPYALWARGGLETMWYTTLLLTSLWLLHRGMQRQFWAFPLAAVTFFALALTRHDGAIPMAICGGIVLLWVLTGGASHHSRRTGLPTRTGGRALLDPRAWAALGSFAGLAAVFLGYTWWRTAYFGQLVPTPFFSRLGGTLADPAAIAHTLGSYFTRGAHYSAYGDLLLPALGLAGIGFFGLRRPGLRDVPVLACAAGLSLLYFVSESYNPGIRYMVPVLPLLYLYAQLPLITLVQRAAVVEGPIWRRALAVGALAAGVAIYLLIMVPRTAYDGQRAEDAKLRSLVPLGQWLHNVAAPGAAVALQDIGVVAYYSGLRVIDNNPGALTNGDLIYRTGQAGFVNLTLAPRPEFLVFTSGSYETPKFYLEFAPLSADARFLQEYQLYGKVKYWEDRCYWVYKRNDVRLPATAQASFPPSDW